MGVEFLSDGPADAAVTLVLAHGAGAAMDSEFMNYVAAGIAAGGIRVLRFEFPYMQKRRETGKARPPDREPVLLDSWREAAKEAGAQRLYIGGKSMGGRMASMVADELEVAGLVCLGYPFHPPGKPEKTRTAHLEALKTPALIVQGSNDAFGTREDVAGYSLSKQIRIHWMEGGNHDLRATGKPRRAGSDEAIAETLSFIAG
ncbi:MAG: alpha/beta family hydrolase [Dehalococcoidia bacterium]